MIGAGLWTGSNTEQTPTTGSKGIDPLHLTQQAPYKPAPAKAGGADSRFIVTNLAGLPKALYEKVYCARGQAENPGLRRGRL